MSSNLILNLGAGKLLPLDYSDKHDFLVNLDKSYDSSFNVPHLNLVHMMNKYTEDKIPAIVYTNSDVWEFLEKFPKRFDQIVMYRFLEHIPRASLLYMIYLLSDMLNPKGTLDIIVPNYVSLAKMILYEHNIIETPEFENHDIIVTTELVNEPSCPHASVWTANRAYYYLEVEKRFKVDSVKDISFEGRNIYIRIKATKTF